jgi:hypothetical protein
MKAASVVLEGLDPAVEGLAERVCNAVGDVGQKAWEVAKQCTGDINDGFELTAYGVREPLVEETPGTRHVRLVPELSEEASVVPSFGSFQLAVDQLLKAEQALVIKVFRLKEPVVSRSFEGHVRWTPKFGPEAKL